MAEFVISRKFIGSFLFVILAFHVWAIFSSAYFNIWWLDIAMHFTGGLWVGLVAIFLARGDANSDIIFFWLVLGLVAIIGIFWEFFEFGMNQVWVNLGKIAFAQPGVPDTLGDLLADMMGGAFAFIIFKDWKKNL